MRIRADLHESFKGSPFLKDIRKQLAKISPEELAKRLSLVEDVQNNCWEYNDTGALWEYKGEKSITTLEEALKFSQVDLQEYEVERYVFNSWDVTSNEFGKRTNYQVKVWFRKIVPIVLQPLRTEPFRFQALEDGEIWVILGCVHRPFHNEALWQKIMHLLHNIRDRVGGIILNGDFLDLRSLSTHDDYLPPNIDLGVEYSSGRQGVFEIKRALGEKHYKRIRKIFHYGNHEERFNRDKKTLAKYGSSLQRPEDAMGMEGWEVQTNYKEGYTKLGKDLSVFHGVYHGKQAAKSHLDAIPNESCVFNHTHRFQSYTHGKHTAYNTGWLGDTESEGFKYAPRQTKHAWANGFSVAYLDKEGNHTLIPIPVDNGKFMFEGKVY